GIRATACSRRTDRPLKRGWTFSCRLSQVPSRFKSARCRCAMTAHPFGSIYDKRKPRDPLSRMIIQNFLGSVRGLIRGLEAQSILDVGCGDGWLTAHLLEARPQASVIAVNVSTALVDLVGILLPAVKVLVAAGQHSPLHPS